MSEPTFWWLVTAIAIGLELLIGTFYLLMLALGTASAALAAHAGLGTSAQLLSAALVGGCAVVLWRLQRKHHPAEPSAQANPNVVQDIGAIVHVTHWLADGTAQVHYRGAQWTVLHRADSPPSPGTHRIAQMIGNRLLVDKV